MPADKPKARGAGDPRSAYVAYTAPPAKPKPKPKAKEPASSEKLVKGLKKWDDNKKSVISRIMKMLGG